MRKSELDPIRASVKLLYFYYEMSFSLRAESGNFKLFAFAPQRNCIFIMTRYFR